MEQTGMQKRAYKVRRFINRSVDCSDWLDSRAIILLPHSSWPRNPIRNYHRDRSDLVDCYTHHYVFLVQTRI